MISLRADFNDAIYRSTGLHMDGLATREEWMATDGGEHLRLVVTKASGAAGVRFFFALYDAAGQPLKGVSVRCNGKVYEKHPKGKEESVMVAGIDDQSLGHVEILRHGKELCSVSISLEETRYAWLAKESFEMKEAWKMATAIRTCPPDKLLFTPESDFRVMQHLEKCLFCRERKAFFENDALMDVLGRDSKIESPEVKPPAAEGQVWLLDESLGGWGQDGEFYYRPPMAVVIEATAGSKIIRVAPLLVETILASVGDIDVGERFGFASAWNTWQMDARHLGVFKGTIDGPRLAALKEMASKTVADVEKDSLLYRFRKMEREAGRYFSSKSLGSEGLSELSDIAAAIRGFMPRIEFPESPQNHGELLAMMILPEEEMPLAASEDDRHDIWPINIVMLQGRSVADVRLGLLDIHIRDREAETLRLAGKIQDLPEAISSAKLFIYLKFEARRPLAATTVELDSETGYFSAVFENLPDDASVPAVAVLCTAREAD